jgi:hypothetical protein
MPEPDIIIPATADPSQVQAWVWVDFLGIDRNGSKPLVTDSGTEDKWRVSWVNRASLAQNGDVLRDGRGREIQIPSPMPSGQYDVADLMHDAQVQQLVVLMRDISIRLARGDLKPLPVEPTEPQEPQP